MSCKNGSVSATAYLKNLAAGFSHRTSLLIRTDGGCYVFETTAGVKEKYKRRKQ
jgi:hypothetical protein